MPIPLWILTGPTASGKTEIGLEITENTGMEIISADSMLVYRGMDIGTEKPSLDRRNKIPHHLIDIADPWEEYSVGQYVKDFDAVAQSLCRQGKQFIVIGGTALYLKALVDGLFEGPPADWEYRNSLKTLAREKGPHYLHTLLGEIDPEAAGKLHFNDQKRIIRHSRFLRQPIGGYHRFKRNLATRIRNTIACLWQLIMIVMPYITG